MKWILIPIFIVMFFFARNFSVDAAPKPKINTVQSISPSAQHIKARNVVRALFGNIRGVAQVTYILMYEGNGVGQGVQGSFTPGKKTSYSQDIYLGTCSGKVCTPHKKIKNIQLQVTTKFTNGKSSSKIYKVK